MVKHTVPSLHGKLMGKQWKQCQTLFFGAPKSLQMVTAAMKSKDATPWRESYDQPRQHIKKQRHYFANKFLSSQGYGFSHSHVWMWELDYKESWAQKNWCLTDFWVVHSFLLLWNRWGNSVRLYFLGLQNHWRWWLWPWN